MRRHFALVSGSQCSRASHLALSWRWELHATVRWLKVDRDVHVGGKDSFSLYKTSEHPWDVLKPIPNTY